MEIMDLGNPHDLCMGTLERRVLDMGLKWHGYTKAFRLCSLYGVIIC